MISEAAQAALTVLFGALAGGVTNSLAIWMLFHPYEPPRFFGRRRRALQGAIPKNKARLAAAIGRTVGTRLLTPEDLANTLADPAIRAAFDERLAHFLAAALDRPWAPLDEALPPGLNRELRSLLADATAGVLGRLDAYLGGEAFAAAAREWANSLADELRDQPIGEFLTPERETAMTAAAERWIAEAVGGEGFERTVADSLDRAAARLLQPGRTLQDVLPVGLVAAIERAVSGYLPLALERLGGLLNDPDARTRVQHILHELLDRLMHDLKFYQRVVAALVITPETVERVLHAIEAEGANKLSELLQDPAVRDAMARKVNDAIVDLLGRPITSVLGVPGDPSFEQARSTVAAWMLSLARDRQTRAFLTEKLQATLSAAERRTWGDLFRRLPPGALADALVAAARSERAREFYRDTADRLVVLALERPLGRPADYLPPDAAARIELALAGPLWTWIQDEVPGVARRVDVERRVEEKIMEFPMGRVEELIRSVTERELVLIVRLGYVLGGVIGLIMVAVNALLP